MHTDPLVVRVGNSAPPRHHVARSRQSLHSHSRETVRNKVTEGTPPHHPSPRASSANSKRQLRTRPRDCQAGRFLILMFFLVEGSVRVTRRSTSDANRDDAVAIRGSATAGSVRRPEPHRATEGLRNRRAAEVPPRALPHRASRPRSRLARACPPPARPGTDRL